MSGRRQHGKGSEPCQKKGRQLGMAGAETGVKEPCDMRRDR